MQEIRDNTTVDPCSDLLDELMRPYLVVSTYLIELLWNFSLCLDRLKGVNLSFVSLLFSLFLKSIGHNMVTKIIWFLNLRHSDTLFGVCFLTSIQQIFLFHSTLKKLNMWSSWEKIRDATQVMHIAKLKDSPKRAMKLSQTILERVFEKPSGQFLDFIVMSH
jgi:hypothetical protein